MMPAFRFERLRRIVPKFCVVAGRLVEQWRQLEDGANVESLPWMSKCVDSRHLGDACH